MIKREKILFLFILTISLLLSSTHVNISPSIEARTVSNPPIGVQAEGFEDGETIQIKLMADLERQVKSQKQLQKRIEFLEEKVKGENIRKNLNFEIDSYRNYLNFSQFYITAIITLLTLFSIFIAYTFYHSYKEKIELLQAEVQRFKNDTNTLKSHFEKLRIEYNNLTDASKNEIESFKAISLSEVDTYKNDVIKQIKLETTTVIHKTLYELGLSFSKIQNFDIIRSNDLIALKKIEKYNLLFSLEIFHYLRENSLLNDSQIYRYLGVLNCLIGQYTRFEKYYHKAINGTAKDGRNELKEALKEEFKLLSKHFFHERN